jgi:hypothetical protein
MHLQGYWHVFMAEAGNKPGAQEGDVVVTLNKPVGGIEEIRVPSNLVTIAAEAGQLIGVQLMTADGRHLFVAAGNLAGIVDAPLAKKDQPADEKADEHKALRAKGYSGPLLSEHAGAAAPETASSSQASGAAHDKAEAAHDKSEAAGDKAAALRHSGR